MNPKIEEKRIEYQTKIIELIRNGFDYNQIALEIERSEGANFCRGIFIAALNEIRETATKPQKHAEGVHKCPKCRREVNIFSNRCLACDAVVRCPSCGENVSPGQYSCSHCLKKL